MSTLLEPVTVIKGIGAETATTLHEMGIVTVADLLEYLPYRYEDYRLKELESAQHEERVTIEGTIHSVPLLTSYGKKKSRLTLKVLIGRALISVIFFNQAYLKAKLEIGTTVTITGKWDRHRQTITGSECNVGPYQATKEFEPVYAVRGKLSVKMMRRFITNAFTQYGSLLEENLPSQLITRYKLMPRQQALQTMHFPASANDVKQARRRMVYEEFLLFQLKMQALRKVQREQAQGIAQMVDQERVDGFIQTLPFPLTTAQQRVVAELLADLTSSFRMNRLLQGDVGSGKTVVAAIGLLATVTAGFQGALMVPTEILAEQHAESLEAMLGSVGLTTALLTSSVKGKKRRELLAALATGEIHVLIGTHALIQEEVHFHKLGLVITDEQHRFGVEQRRVLREKGQHPDVLFMTATPIPRTLAITVFGEMDVSVIDELPAGRKAIETYWAKHHMLDRILTFIEKELRQGRQAYVICPLIEESEKLDSLQNVLDVHAMLSHYYASRFQVGLMHGRLNADEKEDVMKQFSRNDVQILVSTTVVEVGVNVPNATVMVIYDAERFGLSQLHQLRGRVGRGSNQSYCILLADPKTEVGKERMKIMSETNDGFVLSERDLELRGPGDFFGKKQSGLPEFKVADLVHDYRTLEVARDDAAKLIASQSFWNRSEYQPLRRFLEGTGVLATEKLD